MKNKGHDALFLIACLPCVAFLLAITLLGIIKPIMQTLGSSLYHVNDAPFQRFPLKPTPKPKSFIIITDQTGHKYRLPLN